MCQDSHNLSLLPRKVDQMSQLGMEMLQKLQTSAHRLGVLIISLPHSLFSMCVCVKLLSLV